MKVVSSLDLGLSFLCQNPELASSLVTTFAPASLARVCSICCWHWMILSLDGFVQLNKVSANPNLSILFRNNDYGGTPVCRLVHSFDDVHVFHSLQLGFNFGQQWNWNSAWRGEIEWLCTFGKLNLVFSRNTAKTLEQLGVCLLHVTGVSLFQEDFIYFLDNSKLVTS